MTVSALSAARTLCELRDWRISNLELQKLLYLAHMTYLGEREEPLVNEEFEAWDYGPVLSSVYRRAKAFGSAPVRNVFHHVPGIPENSQEHIHLRDTSEQLKPFSSSRLVEITHWSNGAWAQVYRPSVRGIRIPNELVLREFRERERQAR